MELDKSALPPVLVFEPKPMLPNYSIERVGLPRRLVMGVQVRLDRDVAQAGAGAGAGAAAFSFCGFQKAGRPGFAVGKSAQETDRAGSLSGRLQPALVTPQSLSGARHTETHQDPSEKPPRIASRQRKARALMASGLVLAAGTEIGETAIQGKRSQEQLCDVRCVAHSALAGRTGRRRDYNFIHVLR